MKKSRPKIDLKDFERKPPNPRLCEHEGCDKEGEFRAPKSPDNLREYHWFCLDHVREYNKSWDYYKDMPPEQIERSRLSAMTWDRPSWPLGSNKIHLNFTFAADLNLDKPQPQSKAVPKEIRDALSEFDLSSPTTWDDVKTTYKKLAKAHHPDKHKGSKEAEDKLKKINQAYAVLKKFYK